MQINVSGSRKRRYQIPRGLINGLIILSRYLCETVAFPRDFPHNCASVCDDVSEIPDRVVAPTSFDERIAARTERNAPRYGGHLRIISCSAVSLINVALGARAFRTLYLSRTGERMNVIEMPRDHLVNWTGEIDRGIFFGCSISGERKRKAKRDTAEKKKKKKGREQKETEREREREISYAFRRATCSHTLCNCAGPAN